MLSRALLQRQSREKNVQLRRRLQLLHPRLQFQRLLLRLSHQLLPQLLLRLQLQLQHRLPLHLRLPLLLLSRRIRCLGMSLRLAVRLRRLSTTIRYLTAMTMWL